MSPDLFFINGELLSNSSRILSRIPISQELCSHLSMKIGKVDTKSDDSRNLMKFLNDFDQNTDWKF